MCTLYVFPSYLALLSRRLEFLFFLAGMISDSDGGRISVTSNAIASATASRLLCGSSVNGVDSFAVAYNASASAPLSAFSFLNISNMSVVVDVSAPGAINATSVFLAATDSGTASAVTAGPHMAAFPIGQSLSVADFLAGTGLKPRTGLTITVQCEATAPSAAAVIGCTFNNRSVMCSLKTLQFIYYN